MKRGGKDEAGDFVQGAHAEERQLVPFPSSISRTCYNPLYGGFE